MWCKHCRQEVPALAVADEPARGPADACAPSGEPGHYACARCGEAIGSNPAPSPWTDISDLGIDLTELTVSAGPAELPLPRGSGARSQRADAPARYDAWQWELDQELHDVRRLLARRGAAPAETELRVDPPQAPLGPVLSVAAREPAMPEPVAIALPRVRPHPSPQRPRTWAPLSWLILMLGLTATCCGGALLGWSVLSGRNELWSRGVPIFIGGQAALFMALVAMLVKLGRQSQATATQLHEVSGQIANLSASTSPAAGAAPNRPFYVHLAEGAQPQTLLTDLKNQLDLLAISMHRHG